MLKAAVIALILVPQGPAPPSAVPSGPTAVIRGRITELTTGQPLSRVRVRAIHVSGVLQPTVCPITDCNPREGVGEHPTYYAVSGQDGRFEMRNVKAGEYIVQAGAEGYLTRALGQTAYDQPEGRLEVAAGTVTRADIELEQMGTLSGRILSDSGDGLPGVEVELVARRYAPGGAAPRAVAFVQSEADGAFTFRNLLPGQYFVHAYSLGTGRPRRGGESAEYTSTYFPGAQDLAGADQVAIAAGQDVTGVEFPLLALPTFPLTGELVDAGGAALSTAVVQLSPRGRGGVVDPLRAAAARDGRFRFERVLPGEFWLTVVDQAAPSRWLGASRVVTVLDDRTELVIAASPGALLSGRVSVDDREPRPPAFNRLHIEVEQALDASLSSSGTSVQADGSFQLESAAGETYLRVDGLEPGWHVRRVFVDSVDVTDRVFELFPSDRRRVDIVVSAGSGDISGAATDARNRAVAQAIVVLFPDDWSKLSRTRLVRTAFSLQDGRFRIDDVTPGNYRVAAVRWLPRGAWNDPDVLVRLWSASEQVQVEPGGSERVDLRVSDPPEDLFR